MVGATVYEGPSGHVYDQEICLCILSTEIIVAWLKLVPMLPDVVSLQ